jgi:hypothetical protein
VINEDEEKILKKKPAYVEPKVLKTQDQHKKFKNVKVSQSMEIDLTTTTTTTGLYKSEILL